MAILFPYLELAASIFILIFSYNIWARHYENKTARFFARFSLVAFLASIMTYSLRIAFTLDIAASINRVSAPLVALAFAVFVHFALIFTKRDDEKHWPRELSVLYLPAAILTILFLFTNLMYIRYEIFSYGIASIPSPWYWLFIAQNTGYALWGVWLFYSYSRTAPQRVEREQAKLIALGAIFPAVVGIIADELIPILFQTRIVYPTLVLDFAVMSFFIYLAMRRYSLFAISPAFAAQTIIETMPDSLIVTDLEGRVLFLNEEAHKYFHAPKDEIVGRLICDLFSDKSRFDKLYDDVINKNQEIERFEATLCNPLGECLPSYINANALRYELGDLIGIVFVIRTSLG